MPADTEALSVPGHLFPPISRCRGSAERPRGLLSAETPKQKPKDPKQKKKGKFRRKKSEKEEKEKLK